MHISSHFRSMKAIWAVDGTPERPQVGREKIEKIKNNSDKINVCTEPLDLQGDKSKL